MKRNVSVCNFRLNLDGSTFHPWLSPFCIVVEYVFQQVQQPVHLKVDKIIEHEIKERNTVKNRLSEIDCSLLTTKSKIFSSIIYFYFG